MYLFRMTHIENISHILDFGITHYSSVNRNPNYYSIGDGSLIWSRNNFILNNGVGLGAYIPFYFGPRMPMLFVIQNGFNGVKATSPEQIVYCITSVAEILKHKLRFVFTDGHAVDAFTEQYDISQIDNLENIVDFKAVSARYWKDENDLDLKRRKEAEFLVEDDVPRSAILGYAVFSNNSKRLLASYGIEEKQIVVKPDYYF